MKNYPSFDLNDLETVTDMLRYVVKERRIDVHDWNNLTNVFMSGRKVGKIPTGSSDVSPDDRVGDFNYDDDFMYLCVRSGLDAVWRRVELAAW